MTIDWQNWVPRPVRAQRVAELFNHPLPREAPLLLSADDEGPGASAGLLPEASAPDHPILKDARAC